MTDQELREKIHELYGECRAIYTLANSEQTYHLHPEDDEENRFNAALCDFFLAQRYREAGIGVEQ